MHFIAAILATMAISVGAQTPNPPCAICGCSFCPSGFTVGNPTGVIPVPPEFASQAQGLTQVPCSLLDFAGTSGQIPPDLCNDDLRLLPTFRSICGCPPLPAPGPAPVSTPVSVPVSAPIPAPKAPIPAVVIPVSAPVTAPVRPFPAPVPTASIGGSPVGKRGMGMGKGMKGMKGRAVF